MKLDQLRTFLAVLEHGSFSRAAADVGLSQSTVSFHIAALESATGVRLVDRARGGARATPHGAIFKRYAQRITATADEALHRLLEADVTPSGHLQLAASTIVAEHLLPPVLARFRADYPNVSVTVDVSDSRHALEALRASTCDLALIGLAPSGRAFESTRFAHDDIVLVGPPGGRRALGSSAELAQLPLILREPGSGTRSAVADLLAAAHLDRPDILVVGSTEAARRSVMAGLGYSLISRRAVVDDIRARRLRVVSLPNTPKRRSFYVVELSGLTPTAAAKAMRALVLASGD